MLALSLSGCATTGLGPADERVAWDAHLGWLESLPGWRVSGRVAVDVPADAWTANLRWHQQGAGYDIWLGGPFGQGAVTLEGDEAGVELRTAEGRRVRAASPEQLVAEELGADVPISLLRYWLLGRPAPQAAVARLDLDGSGRLSELEQAGWRVHCHDYVDAGAGTLPSRVEIRREGVRARFVLDSWRPGA